MKNLRIYAPLANGTQLPLWDGNETGKAFIHRMFTDDWGPPPLSVVIEADTDDGRKVSILIPYDDTGDALGYVE